MFIDPADKSLNELMVAVSHLYRRMMHTAPSFHFRENYKGTPDSPKTIKGRHEYTVEVGFFQATEKGSTFTALKSGVGESFEKALHKIIEQLNTEW